MEKSKGEVRRLNIFNKFSKQLQSLDDLGLLDFKLDYEKAFICPICFKQFSEEDLNTSKENFLTLEDAPPKSLGGNPNTLTCKKCNNEFGYKIDFHLTEKLNELDLYSFLPNTGSKVTLTHKGIKVQGTLKIDENGEMTIIHLKKVNNPETLESYIANTDKGDTPVLKFPASRVDMKRFEVALLKSAYILAFEQYGYPLILSKAFDIVREQLKKYDEDIYPSGFWTRQATYTRENEGVHLIKTNGFEGFQAIFILKTNSQETGYGVYLPVSASTYKNVIKNLSALEAGAELAFESYKKTNYFEDKTSQKLCVAFMKKRN